MPYLSALTKSAGAVGNVAANDVAVGATVPMSYYTLYVLMYYFVFACVSLSLEMYTFAKHFFEKSIKRTLQNYKA